ncbi:MAG TPA: SpoIIE family protein phosphatase [Smithellaceae bacterium]|nr:SpoIIE family protein phosphatase [Smithellaceae bacterium]
MFVDLVQNLAVLLVMAYVTTRVPRFGNLLNRRFSLKSDLLLGLVFGLISIFGTLSAVKTSGVLANFRDLGPAIAGLLAGPVAGGIAGLIGGAHRYLLGGITGVPCSVATVLAGLICGGFYLWKRGRPIRIWEAAAMMAGVTALHGFVITPLVLGLSEEIRQILRTVMPPMLLVNCAGIALFFFILHNLNRERQNEAEKHRIDSELRIAREIQMGMLPVPSQIGDPRFAVHAVLKPAKEVGGDLYHCFIQNDAKICLAVGDVSGKGISASLHMAITQKLLKALAQSGEEPAELLERLNRELCDGNESMMFVTLLIAFIDLESGKTVFGNGGHNPPYRIRQGGVSRMVLEPGLALGIREKEVYTNQQLCLEAGDTIFLYTDGVTEAMNGRKELFGEKRLKAVLTRLQDQEPEAICRGVLEEIAHFVGQSEPSDDITMLALRLKKAGAAGPVEIR